MRNLLLVGERRRTLHIDDVTKAKEGRRVADVCQSLVGEMDANPSTFALTNDGIVVKLLQGSQIEWIAELDPLCEKPGGEWFSLSLVDTGEDLALVGLSKNGGIVTLSPTTGEAELVGEFDHGLQAGCFSPDGEVLCLLTYEEDEGEGGTKKRSALLLMNTQWEVLAESTIESHVPSEESPDSKVSMCWRPDGSLVALSTVDVNDHTRKVRIFKRDNLQFHAIGRTEDGSGKLVTNIVASCGIHWASAGCSQLLAAAQRKSKKTLQVIFFEPNGNRHREFPLRETGSTIEVLGMTWNDDSTLLAVSLREEGVCDKVQLWHRSNYHWYLKQELRYGKEKVAWVSFHPEKSHLFNVFFENECSWREYEVLWRPSSIQILAPKTCLAYVVDGCSLNMTALDQALIPPPMFASTITMDSPISQIVCSNDESQHFAAMVCLSDGSFVLIGNPVTSTGRQQCLEPRVVAKGSLKGVEGIDYSMLRMFVIVDQREDALTLLTVCSAEENGARESLRMLTINWKQENQTASVVVTPDPIPLDQRVLCSVPWSDSNSGALLELEDGSMFEFTTKADGSGFLQPLHGQEFMEPCAWIAGIKHPASLGANDHQHHNYQDRKELLFGLSRRSRLFCHDILLSDAVSSFFVSISHQYLCFAATDGSTSQLRFLPLSDLRGFDTLLGSDSNVILLGYEPRSVERGARLVAILPENPMAILQMPRGNLEGIYPRALILRFVMSKIAAGEYYEAFTTMRRQKVNLNLIVDLNPRKFLDEGLATFLKQLVNVDYLNLFISCLQNWDSTQHQYVIPHWLRLISERDAEIKKSFDFSTKINQVCTKMRLLMTNAEKCGSLEGGETISDDHYLLPILTTFAKEDPPKLEEALTMIKEKATSKSEQTSAAVKKPPLFSDAAQSSIQYLAFLADHELIFNVGLGLYDFDVARACARNSQMDPKVYLPLLKRLRSLPTFYGRYEVDMRLKRHEKALRNLYESRKNNESLEGVEPQQDDKVDMPLQVGNDFEHCMELIEKYQLHGVGLELFKSDGFKRRQLMISLGDKLLKEGQASSALTVFLAAEPVDIEKAKNAARACKDWRSYFTLVSGVDATNGDASGEDRANAASEIAEAIAMASEGHYDLRSDLWDAARILLDYCDDVDGAIEMLIKGWAWREGCRVALLRRRPDLVQRCIDAAEAFADTLIVDLEERMETFVSKYKRYEEVLEIRKEAIRLGEAEDAQAPEQDNGSIFSAASNVSNMSLHSTASASSHSSVISIKSSNSTTFTLTGREMDTRHLSKFGPNGFKKDKKKKKKKNKPGKKRILPGSAEELQSLVDLLTGSCVNEDFGQVISTTIEFLAQTGQMLDTARSVYKCYMAMNEAIEKCHLERAEEARRACLADISKPTITLPSEEIVDKLANVKLPDSVAAVFSLL